VVRVGINGFGRIGRAILRARFRYPEFHDVEVVAINDLSSPEMLAYLLKYDSVYGRLPYEVHTEGGYLIINNKKIRIFQEKEPEKIPWREEGIDYVVESTGKFFEAGLARGHIMAGAKRVVISSPAYQEDITIVMGVNHDLYDPAKHFIISNASCTTNCLAPVLHLLMKFFEVEKVSMTSVHSYTNDQRLLDKIHPRDFRRARAAGINMIPTTSELFNTITKVLPELDGKIDGYSIRVPTSAVSLLDLNILVKEEVTPAEVNEVFKNNQNKYIRYAEEPIVSIDVLGEKRSAVIDGLSTKVIGGNLVKLLVWYDNEWSYSVRLLDLLSYMAEKEV